MVWKLHEGMRTLIHSSPYPEEYRGQVLGTESQPPIQMLKP